MEIGWGSINKKSQFKTTFIFTYIKSDSKYLKHTDFCVHISYELLISWTVNNIIISFAFFLKR